MSKIKALAAGAALLLAVVFSWVGIANAQSFYSGKTINLDDSAPVYQTIFAAGENININNDVYGDIFCGGQTVTISGTVHGDIICAGQNVHVSGKVYGDVRLAGQTVNLSGAVSGNASIAGQNFTLESSGSIGGDASVATSTTTIYGTISRDLALGGDASTVDGTVGRDLRGNLSHLTLGSNAQVKRNVDYTSTNQITQSTGSTVGGVVTQHQPTQSATSMPNNGSLLKFGVLWFGYWALAFLFAALIAVWLFPRLVQSVVSKATPRPWKALLVGIVSHICLPIVIILLGVTIIGLPVAFILVLLWMVIILSSTVFFAYYIGRLLLRNSHSKTLIALLGSLVFVSLWFIPFIGIFAWIVGQVTGTGMILLELFERAHPSAISKNKAKKVTSATNTAQV
jgi:cytoskeletal protein CcmA (bactofilin family)